MYTTATIRGLLLGLTFIGTVTFGQFIAPVADPFVSGSNSPAPIDVSNSAQIKYGNMGANYFTATNSFCLGSNCRTAAQGWWPTTPVPTTCQLESKKIYTTTTNLPVYSDTCENMLSVQARNDGWVSTSFDYCTSLSSGNCNGRAQCHYMRLVCSGSATTTAGTSVRYSNIYPVTSTQTGDSYATFMRDPQCNDGIDQPNPDADVLVDYPNDPQCIGYDDDDEAN
jgi:hypothetical protein